MAENSFLGTETQPDYVPTSDEKTLALLSHILTFIAPLLAPLVIWLIKKDESQFVAYHAKESLNFQISLILYFLVACVLIFIFIGLILIWIIGMVASILIIVATIRASEGKLYKYPFSIRLIS